MNGHIVSHPWFPKLSNRGAGKTNLPSLLLLLPTQTSVAKEDFLPPVGLVGIGSDPENQKEKMDE
jgi:hypothetical protein